MAAQALMAVAAEAGATEQGAELELRGRAITAGQEAWVQEEEEQGRQEQQALMVLDLISRRGLLRLELVMVGTMARAEV
jgi:hypothetical protein